MLTKIIGRNLANTIALAMVFAVASAPAITAANAQDADTITIKNFDFSPMMVTVKAGSTVTWKNLDGEPHVVVSFDGTFRSPALDQNDSYSYKFDKPGTYKYVCSIHPQMRAEIIVR